MLLMVEKGIRGGVCHPIYRYAKANNKYMKNYNKDKEESFIQYLDDNNLYVWAMSQKLPVGGFKWKKNYCKKIACSLYDKKNYVIHIRSLKQALNHGLILKKIHRVIQFYQEVWLKPYIDINTELRKKAKNDFENDFVKLMNNAVYEKTMENVRKHRDIKLVTTYKRRNRLGSEPNYHTTKWFSEKLLAIGMKKTK